MKILMNVLIVKLQLKSLNEVNYSSAQLKISTNKIAF